MFLEFFLALFNVSGFQKGNFQSIRSWKKEGTVFSFGS